MWCMAACVSSFRLVHSAKNLDMAFLIHSRVLGSAKNGRSIVIAYVCILMCRATTSRTEILYLEGASLCQRLQLNRNSGDAEGISDRRTLADCRDNTCLRKIARRPSIDEEGKSEKRPKLHDRAPAIQRNIFMAECLML